MAPILGSSTMKDRKRSGWFDKPTRQDDWRALGVFLGLDILVFAYAFLVSMGGLAVALVASLCCICVLTAQLWRSTGRQGQTRTVGNRVRPPVQPPRPRPSSPWPAAKRRFAELQRSYAGYECDPMAVLRLPALADVTVPSTARFIDALAEAQALDSDHEPPATHQQAYVAAVDHAHRAWTAAREAAERIRLRHLTPAERSTVDRVIKLLTTAKETHNDAERSSVYARARQMLATLQRGNHFELPRPAQAALEVAARSPLPA